MAAITIFSDFGAPQNKVWHCFHCFPIFLILTSTGSSKKFQKNIYFFFIDYVKAFNCVDHNKLWKNIQELGIPDHLTCLLRNLFAGQGTIVRTRLGTTHWFQLGKEYVKAVYCHPACLTFMQSTSWEIPGVMKPKLEWRLWYSIPHLVPGHFASIHLIRQSILLMFKLYRMAFFLVSAKD